MKTYFPDMPHLTVEQEVPFDGFFGIQDSVGHKSLLLTREEVKVLRRLLKRVLADTKPGK